MNQPGTQNLWAEINGGIRGSSLLNAGAVVTILATVQLFAAGFLGEISGLLVSSAWLCWITALWLLATGFFWIGVQPLLGRFGLLVGTFHFFNGLSLLLVIFLGVKPFVPNASLSIGRTLLLLFFVLIEKKYLKPFHIRALVSVAFLQFLKISLRTTEVLPSFGKLGDSALDSTLLILMAVSILLISRDIKRAENAWARELLAGRASGFGDFNNPEHKWNESSD